MGAVYPELKDVVDILKSLLKRAGLKVKSTGGSGLFALLRLPDSGIELDVEWKRLVNEAVLLSVAASSHHSRSKVHILATKSLSAGAFSQCLKSGQSVLDSAGNGIIHLPGFWYERFVESNKPRRLPVSGTPFSAKASRIVRAFLSEPQRQWSQSELVNDTGVTQGYASKSLKMLAEHSYIASSSGRWRLQEPAALLDDWSAHYRFDRHRLHRFAFSSPSYDDGLQRLGKELGDAGIPYAYTGWSGAHLRAPYAIPPKTMAFVDAMPGEPKKLGLFPVEEKENVLLIVPNDEGVLQYTQIVNQLVVASDAQIYVDLIRLSGRAKEQADVLRDRLMNRKDLEHA